MKVKLYKNKIQQLILQRRVCVILTAFATFFFLSRTAFSYEKVKFVDELRWQMQQPTDVAISPNGNIFVLDEALGQIFVYDAKEGVSARLGSQGQGELPLIRPKSLTLSHDGKLAVADTDNHRIVILDMKGNLLFKFGELGSASGQFRRPISVVMDQAGFIYVADQENNRIQIFSPKGIFLNFFPVDSQPAALAIDREGYLYVLVPAIGKVLKYDTHGNKQKEIVCSFNGGNVIEKATSLNVDYRGDLYIIEGIENSIKKFDQSGELLISFGSYGSGRGQFANPQAVKSDSGGKIYIADKDNNRVQVLRILGNTKEPLAVKNKRDLIVDFYSKADGYNGAADLFHHNDTIYILSDQHSKVISKGRKRIEFGSLGIEPGEFNNPHAFFVGWDNNVYVANTGNHCIQIFHEDGILEYQFGREGEKTGEFNAPHGVAVNSKGIIFVADTNNNRIQFFNNDGIFLGFFGGVDSGGQQSASSLRYPKAMAIDSQDRIFVVDSDGTRIMVFNSNGEFLGKLNEFKESFIQREKIVDMFFDENDNFFLLDAFNSRIKIINRYGKYEASFGARGVGRGYFQNASSITVGEGKIYVSDYDLNTIQTFRYFLDGLENEERIFSTKMMEPAEDEELNNIAVYTEVIKKATWEARVELNKDLKLPANQLKKVTKIESVEKANNGQVKVTVSMPRYLLDNLIVKEAPKTRKVVHEENANQ